MRIEPVSHATLTAWADQRVMLWPDDPDFDFRADAAAQLAAPDADHCNLVALDEDGAVTGFAEATIRHDYVNGTTTSPVVFLEGIFVLPAHRRNGVAAALVAAVAAWGRARGCSEFASDALIDNHASHAFHAAIGFIEQERVVCFAKPL